MKECSFTSGYIGKLNNHPVNLINLLLKKP